MPTLAANRRADPSLAAASHLRIEIFLESVFGASWPQDTLIKPKRTKRWTAWIVGY
jgi:hypothetical protein